MTRVHDAPLRDVAIAGMATALTAALAHVAIVYWRPILVGEIPLGWGRDLVWMAPISYLAAYAIVVALLILIAALFPRPIGFGTVVGTFAFFTALAALLLVPAIQQYASLLLALGVGVQVGRVAVLPLRLRLPGKVPGRSPTIPATSRRIRRTSARCRACARAWTV